MQSTASTAARDHPQDASGALRNGAQVTAQTMMDPGLQSQNRFFGVSVALYGWLPLLVGLLFAAEIIPPPLALIWYRTVVDG